jgi:hypothetical protein
VPSNHGAKGPGVVPLVFSPPPSRPSPPQPPQSSSHNPTGRPAASRSPPWPSGKSRRRQAPDGRQRPSAAFVARGHPSLAPAAVVSWPAPSHRRPGPDGGEALPEAPDSVRSPRRRGPPLLHLQGEAPRGPPLMLNASNGVFVHMGSWWVLVVGIGMHLLSFYYSRLRV